MELKPTYLFLFIMLFKNYIELVENGKTPEIKKTIDFFLPLVQFFGENSIIDY